VKVRREIKDSFPLIEIISDKSLKILNSLFKTNYTKPNRRRNTAKGDLSFRDYKRLMEIPPGFDRDVIS